MSLSDNRGTFTDLTRTRQSLGSQLRESLDMMVASGRIQSWEIIHAPDGRMLYQVSSAVTTSLGMTPGECMDWLNRHGYSVRIGKA